MGGIQYPAADGVIEIPCLLYGGEMEPTCECGRSITDLRKRSRKDPPPKSTWIYMLGFIAGFPLPRRQWTSGIAIRVEESGA